jgi:DUF2946 family protein
MGPGGLYRYRRIAGACALIGVLFYAALIPVHIVSEVSTALLGAELGDALDVICHGSLAFADHTSNGSVPAAPTVPQKHCPFCQGLVAFQVAIASANTLSIIRIAVRAAAPDLTDEGLASTSLPAPQNRGPPAFLY